MITQRLILVDGPEGSIGLTWADTKIWACAGCRATISEGHVISHSDDCPEMRAAGITHRCPPEGSGIMPCCGRTPFDVPRTDRMTLDPLLVTCPASVAAAVKAERERIARLFADHIRRQP